MLTENEDVISFCPGSVHKGKVTLGRIVVHDRLKVEANVLPRYFNHSSFASLRRQLNYFSFTRLGKGRQRGATYCNEAVIELEDILRLKRRSATAPPPKTPLASTPAVVDSGSQKFGQKRTPRVSISSMEEVNLRVPKKARHNALFGVQTVSDSEDSTDHAVHKKVGGKHHRRITLDLTTPSSNGGEDDVLAGCQALLSFATSTVH